VAQKRNGNNVQTAEHVIQPFQTFAEDIFIWSAGPKRSLNPPLTAL